MEEQFIVKSMAITWPVQSCVHRMPPYHVAKRLPNEELQSQSRTSDVYRSCAVPYSREREVGKLRYNSLLHAPQYTDRFKQLEHFITSPYHMEGRGKGRKSESRGRGIQQSYNPIRNPGVISPKPRPPILEKPALRSARSIILVRKKNSRFCTSHT